MTALHKSSKYKHVGCNFIRQSELADIEPFFDEKFYRLSDEAKDAGIRPVEHYLVLGERQGVTPSKDFDPVFYAKQYPDLLNYRYSLFHHYVLYGRSEGRSGRSMVDQAVFPNEHINPDRKTVLVLFHEASRTGAPILGWNILNELKRDYNVVAVLMRGGPISHAIEMDAAAMVELPHGMKLGSYDSQLLAQKLKACYRPHYVVANSAMTHVLAVQLEKYGVPVVALVHEFASDMPQEGILNGLYKEASRIVFPARIVAEDSQATYSALRGRAVVTQPQGPSRIPSRLRSAPASDERRGSPVVPFLKDHRFTVFGMGTFVFRKGVDLFVSVADYLQREMNRRDIRFIWIGHLYPREISYKLAIELQVKNCNLDEIVEFIDEVDDLGPYYEAADLLFLSSRTDPLPNVAIDAMLKGVPIACFENASGFSDILATHDETRHLVAPYASVSGAAKVIARAMDDQSNACEVSTFLKQQAAELFDLKTYVEKIDSYGNEAAAHLEQMHQNADNILDTGLFNKEFHFGDVGRSMEETQAVKEYLNNIRMNWPLARHNTGTFIRRPVVGFNPLIYNFENPVQPGVFLDPLSDFLSKGRPAGPWLHRVFGPTKELAPSKLKTAIHGHFHYPDLLGDFLRSLGVNQTRPDLFITTTSGEKMAEINVELERTGWHAKDVWVVPNLGRDIYPFIKELPQRLAAHYDIVGHIHGKKSKHVDAQIGDRWRNFAWQHILGDQNPMVDLISAAFSNNSDIGLIFPEDPHLNGWDRNEKIATEMAGRMGLATPLPIHFDFPVGTMFWARPEALKPLFEMELDSSEIPVEPVAEDGTILHAFERLIPFVVAKTGFNYATTHVAGVNR